MGRRSRGRRDDIKLWKPALSFDTDEPEFVRGFEAGRLWTLLQGQPAEVVEENVHVSNVEMVMRISDVLRRRAVSQEIGDGWLLVRFDPAVSNAA